MNVAFKKEEKKRILKVKVETNDSINSKKKKKVIVSNKIFLLSVKEMYKYFSSNDSRICLPTLYTNKKINKEAMKVHIENRKDFITYKSYYWLRTHSPHKGSNALVENNGNIKDSGNGHIYKFCLRPAIWIEL